MIEFAMDTSSPSPMIQAPVSGTKFNAGYFNTNKRTAIAS
jgi:hypothetical protein